MDFADDEVVAEVEKNCLNIVLIRSFLRQEKLGSKLLV